MSKKKPVIRGFRCLEAPRMQYFLNYLKRKGRSDPKLKSNRSCFIIDWTVFSLPPPLFRFLRTPMYCTGGYYSFQNMYLITKSEDIAKADAVYNLCRSAARHQAFQRTSVACIPHTAFRAAPCLLAHPSAKYSKRFCLPTAATVYRLDVVSSVPRNNRRQSITGWFL